MEADPIASLAALDDVELIDDEVFGSMREFGDGVEEVDASGWYLTRISPTTPTRTLRGTSFNGRASKLFTISRASTGYGR